MSELTQEKIDALPTFAQYVDGRVEVDPGVVYPQYLAELAECREGVDKNQYWVEVARRCMTHDIKMAIGGGFTLKLANPVHKNDAWALHKLPEREGEAPGLSALLGSAEFLTHWNALQRHRQQPSH